MPDFRAVNLPAIVWPQNAIVRMMVANIANGVSTAQAPPPTMVIAAPAPPPLQSPPVLSALQPSPTERLNASSTSPTNTSGSDGSAVSGLDIAAVLAACQKQEFPPVQQDPPIANPLFTMPDASAILQFFQSQQAAMIQAAAQRAAVVQQQAQQQQEQHRAQQTTERKRSYPCTFQFCVICQKDVHSSKLPCHIRQCHVAKPMFQCPACDFTSTYSKNNVKSHMVSLHGLAGDPISYMDRYAPQVEEFMRMCFPNVRGRGRPMQGRGSPRSPASPQSVAQRRQSQQNARRASYARDNELLVQAQQQQLQQAQAQAALLAQAQSLNQLSIFPQLFNNNNINLVTQNGGMKTPIAVKPEPMEQDTAPVSSASSLDDIQTAQTNSVGSSRQMSLASTGSTRHTAQTVRPGENWQPRYNALAFEWALLNGNQIKDTIFSGLPDIFEKIEGLDVDICLDSDSLLNVDQETKIKCVRGAVKIQNFEIIFAIHRMDPSVLKTPENLDLLISIAPSAIDSQKVRDWMEAHPNAQYNEEEQLIIALAQVKNLEERLSIMRHMAHFDLDLSVISEQLSSLSSSTKALSSSTVFKSLVQLVLAAQNLIYSSSTHSIRGFIVSQLEDICKYKLSSGQTLLSVMAAVVKERHDKMSALFDLIPILETASKTSFVSILSSISRLEEENTRADLEIKESFNDVVASFLESSQNKLSSVHETALSVKDELLGLMSYLAEPLPRATDVFAPETVFRRLASFLVALRQAVDTV